MAGYGRRLGDALGYGIRQAGQAQVQRDRDLMATGDKVAGGIMDFGKGLIGMPEQGEPLIDPERDQPAAMRPFSNSAIIDVGEPKWMPGPRAPVIPAASARPPSSDLMRPPASDLIRPPAAMTYEGGDTVMPLVTGTVMRRQADGSMEPIDVARTRPIGVAEGMRTGIIDPSGGRPVDNGPLIVETPGQRAMVEGLRAGRDKAMSMGGREAERQGIMDATRGERWGFATGGPSGPTSAINRRAQGVVDAARGERSADRASDRRVSEALRTPQAVAGQSGITTWTPDLYDPKKGTWNTVEAQRGGGGNTNVTVKPPPESLMDLDADKLMEMNVKFGKPKRVTPKELDNIQFAKYQQAQAAGDQAAAQAVLDAASQEWTPEARAQQEAVQAEMRRRGIAAGAGAAAGGGAKSWKEVLGK